VAVLCIEAKLQDLNEKFVSGAVLSNSRSFNLKHNITWKLASSICSDDTSVMLFISSDDNPHVVLALSEQTRRQCFDELSVTRFDIDAPNMDRQDSAIGLRAFKHNLEG
jgi:hypothetical protein